MNKISLFKPYVNSKAIEYVSQVLQSGWVGEGSKVREFEEKIGARVGTKFPVVVNSGTAALHLAVLIAGVEKGDEVITTPQTMLATTTSILMAGAKPVYADVEYATGNIAAEDIAHRITEKTKAILAVDWGGYPCDWDSIMQIAQANNLTLIEDAAHALGSYYKGKPAGSVVPITCFSFQAIKHLTTGDGGLLCLSNSEDHERAIRLRWYGIDRFKRKPSVLGEPEWDVKELGYKYHMNDIAAAIGLANLEDLDKILERRHQIVAEYRNSLANVAGVKLFERRSDRHSADWLFSIHVERRERFCEMMAAKDIMVSVVHLRIDRNSLCGGERHDLPELAHFTETHVSLPLHPYLSDEDVQQTIDAVKSGW
jgi:perosamine synthetase